MSNFKAFAEQHLKLLLDPFIPGKSQNVTPFKFEALTPDIFALAFRATGQDGSHRFFVSLEFDYIKDLASAGTIIEGWMDTSISSFWRPDSAPDRDRDLPLTLADVQARYNEHYYCLLAQIERPGGDGYWAKYIRIMPGDDVHNKIGHLPDKQQKTIRKALAKIIRLPEESTLNNSGQAITVLAHDDGKTEYFLGNV